MHKKSDYPWIKPAGGLGDALMLSGVLYQVFQKFPIRKFNLINTNNFHSILFDHPAIAQIGFPSADAEILSTEYWTHKLFNENSNLHAYTILARMFGINDQKEMKLFVPSKVQHKNSLRPFTSDKTKIALGPTSASPRKVMSKKKWNEVAMKLDDLGYFTILLSDDTDFFINTSYSLQGATTPLEAIEILRQCDFLIASDSFLMHAAHLVGIPSIILWGPTDPYRYGYPGNIHIRAQPLCPDRKYCLSNPTNESYKLPCKYSNNQKCMNQIVVNDIILKLKSALIKDRKHIPTMYQS
ncbi:MAG: glycosyltransferase family 9 protein [Candidatus Thiodiazotropha taylori]